MSIRFSSLKPILDIFDDTKIAWVSEISQKLGKSKVVVHKYIKELVTKGIIVKIGTGPRTKYRKMASKSDKIKTWSSKKDLVFSADFADKELMDRIFLKFDADGTVFRWMMGFVMWCRKRWLDPHKKMKAFLDIYSYLKKSQNECGLLDAKKSFWKSFKKVFPDNVFYADQYTWKEFGRGKLAELTFYAKQSQNTSLISQSIDGFISQLECLIQKGSYDALAMVPWSIDRKHQFLKILKQKLQSLGIPFVKLIKYYKGNVVIPQKSLKTSEQRIQNASNTIFVDDSIASSYRKVLVIDDFVGSWATINEVARKLKEAWVKKVDGFAIVGNLDVDYEIIQEI